MGAFKGNQARGQMGYGSQGMGDEPLRPVETPQSVGRAFRGKQAGGAGAYTSNDRKSVMDKDAIRPDELDSGNKSRYDLIFAANEVNRGLSQPLPKPPGHGGRMTVGRRGGSLMATRPHFHSWPTDPTRRPLPVTVENVLRSCPCPGTPGHLGEATAQAVIDRLLYCGFSIVETEKVK
jgi:hypothetical protein